MTVIVTTNNFTFAFGVWDFAKQKLFLSLLGLVSDYPVFQEEF